MSFILCRQLASQNKCQPLCLKSRISNPLPICAVTGTFLGWVPINFLYGCLNTIKNGAYIHGVLICVGAYYLDLRYYATNITMVIKECGATFYQTFNSKPYTP